MISYILFPFFPFSISISFFFFHFSEKGTPFSVMATKTKQRKAQRGVPLNLMVVGMEENPLLKFSPFHSFPLILFPHSGQSGLGKSTFVKTFVGKDLVPARDYDQFNDLTDRTVEISSYTEGLGFFSFFFFQLQYLIAACG